MKDAPKKSAGKAKGGKAKGREEDMIWAKASDGELTAADVAHIRDVFTRTREEGLEAVGGSNSLAALDEPKQGYIKGSSLHRVILEVGHRCTQREEAALLDKLVSSNGHVSFERFMEWWTKTVRQQSTVLDRDEMKAISMKRFQSSEKKPALQRKRERAFWCSSSVQMTLRPACILLTHHLPQSAASGKMTSLPPALEGEQGRKGAYSLS